jgi:hypothetical protein
MAGAGVWAGRNRCCAGPHHPDEQPLEFYVCGNVNAFPYYDKNSQWAPAVGAILLF